MENCVNQIIQKIIYKENISISNLKKRNSVSSN